MILLHGYMGDLNSKDSHFNENKVRLKIKGTLDNKVQLISWKINIRYILYSSGYGLDGIASFDITYTNVAHWQIRQSYQQIQQFPYNTKNLALKHLAIL